jgi:hypothetical protein
MSEAWSDYLASMARLDALKAAGVDSAPAARAFRLELKHALRALRRLMAEDASPEVRGLHKDLRRCLKRMHWQTIQVERAAVALSLLTN